jgi:hypothetical protein
MSASRWFVLFLVTSWLWAPSTWAHRIDHLTVSIDLSEDRKQMTVEFSAEVKRVLETQEALSLLPSVERGGQSRENVLSDVKSATLEYFPSQAQVLIDGVRLSTEPLAFDLLEVDEKDAVEPEKAQEAQAKKHLFAVGRWTGPVPPQAKGIQAYASGKSAMVFQRTIAAQPLNRGAKGYFPGETSSVFDIQAPAPNAATAGADTGSATPVTVEDPEDNSRSLMARYIPLGYDHILPPKQWLAWSQKALSGVIEEFPDGLDHILFVLGLFFLVRQFKPLLLQVTVFTLAHSVTLGLAMANVITLPERPVEVLIAASIAFVAIENLFTDRLHKWRTGIVFIFGLIHGVGFAGAFKEIGIPEGQFLTGLLSFNIGVELGQLTVVALAALLCGWAWQKPWYRTRVVIPASVLIALVGLYWTVTRLTGE